MTDSFLRSATSSSNTCNKNKFQVVYCVRSTQNYQDTLYFQNVNTISWHMSKCNFIYTHTKCIFLLCPFSQNSQMLNALCVDLLHYWISPKLENWTQNVKKYEQNKSHEYAITALTFTKHTTAQWYYTKNFYTKFHPNQLRNLRSSNSLIP
jgi:hypothetical protein